jgi:hypothetical protein
MNLHLIEIMPLNSNLGGPDTLRPPQTSDYQYTAIAIEEGGKFYYWAKGVSIEISAKEYEYVITNPKLYYFSTALKLDLRIKAFLKQWKGA